MQMIIKTIYNTTKEYFKSPTHRRLDDSTKGRLFFVRI